MGRVHGACAFSWCPKHINTHGLVRPHHSSYSEFINSNSSNLDSLHVIMKAAFILFVSVMVIFSVSHMAEAGCDAPCIGLEEQKSQQILRGLRQEGGLRRGRRALNLPITVASGS